MLIGRKKEKKLLLQALESDRAEMVAVIGRRRVGKTFLILNVFKDHIIYELTGSQYAPVNEQLIAFYDKLSMLTDEDFERPDNWLEAFLLLKKHLIPHLSDEKKLVIFFDELPWLATPESAFLRALAYWWNDWASRQNLVVVVCGSASSWIIQKVINHKGGLHNRITQYLHIYPFTLGEVEEYLQAKYMQFTHYQITQMYMAFGGIPYYLEEVKKSESAIQNINRICFSETGRLRNEFSRLYNSLFEDAEHHIAVIRALAQKHRGLSRTEIIKNAKVPNGSTTTRVLEELEQSDFIMAYNPFGKKKKDKIYRLSDEYSLFYLRFIEDTPYRGEGTFMELSQRQEFKIWSGYAFEGICMKHIDPIRKALGISGVYTTTFSFLKKATEDEEGLQIDMMLERADHIMHLFEIKFYNTEFVMSKDYYERVQARLFLFRRIAKTKNQAVVTMITPFGMKHNQYSRELVHSEVVVRDLFEK